MLFFLLLFLLLTSFHPYTIVFLVFSLNVFPHLSCSLLLLPTAMEIWSCENIGGIVYHNKTTPYSEGNWYSYTVHGTDCFNGKYNEQVKQAHICQYFNTNTEIYIVWTLGVYASGCVHILIRMPTCLFTPIFKYVTIFKQTHIKIQTCMRTHSKSTLHL